MELGKADLLKMYRAMLGLRAVLERAVVPGPADVVREARALLGR